MLPGHRGRPGPQAGVIRGRVRTGRVVVLVYHRVAELRSDPWALAVSPVRFERQLEMIQREIPLLSLSDLSAALGRHALPHRAAVVTFDDGYADTLEAAAPALCRHGVPATVFVTTSPQRAVEGFWWDQLDAILLAAGPLPELLPETITGGAGPWCLGGAACYAVAEADRHRRWRASQPPPTPRHVLYLELWERLKSLAESERRDLLGQLSAWAGRLVGVGPEHRLLSMDEVEALARCPGVEIGAHTETHPSLAGLPAAAQRREIESSKDTLEALIGRPVSSFAYPYGQAEDITEETVGLVREAGFATACINTPGAITGDSDRFRLPRLFVRDWDAQRLRAELDRQLASGGVGEL